ncbi:hypothetical protein F2Q70_00017692 [Brassica cretica]|uniref:Uncharacterized protein n=1 Tax=Brassica cretica TaxID=69181 RepID=A0A8S9I4P0_BRACR|nr:hypothetical protein F2Q70_00017692 [Brassica cretica]
MPPPQARFGPNARKSSSMQRNEKPSSSRNTSMPSSSRNTSNRRSESSYNPTAADATSYSSQSSNLSSNSDAHKPKRKRRPKKKKQQVEPSVCCFCRRDRVSQLHSPDSFLLQRVFVAAGIVFGGVEAAPAGEKLRRIRAVAADQLHNNLKLWSLATGKSIEPDCRGLSILVITSQNIVALGTPKHGEKIVIDSTVQYLHLLAVAGRQYRILFQFPEPHAVHLTIP